MFQLAVMSSWRKKLIAKTHGAQFHHKTTT